MKQKMLAFALLVSAFVFSGVQAQVNVVIGTGTATNTGTTYPCPIQDWYEGSRAQYLYTAAELTAAGMAPGSISAIKFTVTDLGTFSGTAEEFTIRMGTTANTSLTATTWETVAATNLYGPVNYVPTVGVNTFTFTTPFFWNGTSNIVVEICNGDANNASSVTYTNNPLVTWTTGLSFNGSHTYISDDLGNLCGTGATVNSGTQTTRPNIIFTYTASATCSGTPTGGTAVSSLTNITCPGTAITLSLTGATLASGLTYLWQQSTDNVNWLPAGATTASFTTIPTNPITYYRCIVTCTSSGASATSASVQVTAAGSPVFAPLPYIESFENTWINGCAVKDIPNASWKNTPATGDASWRRFDDNTSAPWASNFGAYTPGGSVGVNSARFHTYNAASGTSGTFDLYLNCNTPATNKRILFDYINTSGNDSLSILISTNGGNSFVRIDSAGIAATWRTKTLFFNSTSATTIIRFKATSDFGVTDIGIDNLNISDYAACSGTPVGGTAVSTLTTIICPGSPFTLSLTGATQASGLTYQWQSSATATGPWSNIPNATTATFTTTQSATLQYYQCIITCTSSGASATSASVQVTSTGSPVYAPIPYIESFENTWINGCGVKDIPNASWKNTPATGNASWRRFDDNTSAPWTSNTGAYTPGGSVGVNSARFHTYDATSGTSGTFDLYLNCSTAASAKRMMFDYINTSGTDSLSILISTNGGTSFVRIDSAGIAGTWRTKTIFFTSLSATTVIRFKATSDYGFTDIGIDNLNITDFGDCTGTPTGGTTVSTVANVCLNTIFTLSVTGATDANGLTYQWQKLNTVTNVWENITGATGATYDAAQAVSTSYRRLITCTFSSGNATSAPVTVSTPASVSGTFTINSAIPTGGINFQSFNAAYDYIKCGINAPVIFNVNATSGPYNEQLIMAAVPGASAVNTVTFYGNGRTLKYSSTNTNERAVIKLNDADHIRFDSLVIDATPVGTGTTYGYGVQFINNADSNTIRRCTISTALNTTSTNYAGIVMNASATGTTTTGSTLCDSNYIAQNTVSGGYYSVTLVGSGTEAVQRNVLFNNTLKDFYFYGVYIVGNFNSLIDSNDISRPNATTVGSLYGIYLSGLSVGVNITKNRFHTPFGGVPNSTSGFYGIYHTSCDAIAGLENKVTNNLFYDINGQGAIYALYNFSSDNTWYYHNTISLDNTASTSTLETRGFYQTSTASGINFFNNIINISRGGSGTKHAVYLAATFAGDSLNRNDYYVTSTSGSNNVGYYISNQPTLAQWQTATGQDANSLVTNPLYTAPATGNYLPRSVVLDNRAAPVGVLTDIVNTARSLTTPDIGAYEFAIPVCTTPPTAGASVAVPNSGICLGAQINLSLSGNTSGSGQTVQWQYSATLAGPWTNLGNALPFPDTTIAATTTLYYRAVLTCSGNSATSTPVLVTINPAFLSGFYTINSALPVSTTNFQNFATAVAAMECGITGFVTFDVSPGTYTEQIRMHRIFGAGANSRVTFRSLTGVPASVILTSAAATPTANYVLQLDSASYITYKNISITGTNTTSARVVDFSNTASYDSIVNCTITAPLSTSTANTSAGIFSNTLIGGNNVIKGNTVVNGANGIYLAGVSTVLVSNRNVIDSNTVNGSYYYGIYAAYNNRLAVTKNTINTAAPVSTTAYSLYGYYCDSAYQFVGNNINISNTTGTVYGMYISYCDALLAERGRVANNKIQAITGNTGTQYGLYENYGSYNFTVNNIINIKTTGTTSYGIYSNYDNNNNYWNNTVQNASTGTGTGNVAAYYNHTSGITGNVNIQNNIFSHTGGGRALSITNAGFLYSDYNTLYTTGGTLVASTTPNGTYATLPAWQQATTWDVGSIAYPPAFVSASDLSPNLADPTVWGIHGRGTQILNNNYDFYNNPRPTTLQAGVPDMGAIEFLPTSIPVALTATPAAPAAGTTQTFMLGTDTVTKITWPAAGTVPPSVTLRRYSGVLPPGLPASTPQMYFYVDADTMPVASYNATVRQYYIDPWQGFINNQIYIKMGKTLLNGSWTVNSQSVVNDLSNYITESGINYLDKFTGLTDGTAPPPAPQIVLTGDSSNRGTQFWVGYGHNYYFNSDNSQDMVLYLSAEQAANVTVRVNGTSYVKTYAVPANTAITSTPLPKLGTGDSRLLTEGLSNRGISITSDVPIVAYAHIYAGSSSGASLLLPVGTYGYEYTALGSPQSYTSTDYSWVNVIAAYDSTLVTITPAKPTLGGRPAGVPFNVMMNKGDVYQVLGAIDGSTFNGYDMTGTKVLSVANSSGKCYPIAVFSGSSRTGYGCGGTLGGSGDNVIQQNFPSQAWGRRYLTAPSSLGTAANSLMTNIYRVAVKDPTTVVRRNGAILTGLINNFYYQFESNTADYITGDKPIFIAQLFSSTGSCPNTGGDGDPEEIYISPIEQGIKKVALYRNTAYLINEQYLTLIIPTGGVPSLRVDGSAVFDYTYPHPNLAGYTVVVKRWAPAAAAQAVVTSDSAFTAITYGLGSVESYGYNAGTLVKNLNALPVLNNTLNATGTANQYTCAKAPFRVSILLPLRPTQLVWNFSALSNITPNTNVTQVNPTLIDSTNINGTWYYRYTINQDYVIADSGSYDIPVTYSSPTIEGCNNSITYLLRITVKAAPKSDFTATPTTVCVGQPVQFNGTGASPGFSINRWNWSFPDTTTSAIQNPVKTFATPGVKLVALRVITIEGCIGDTVKPITVNALPVVNLVRDSISICPGAADTLKILSPQAGAVYNWYTVATGGTPVFTGVNFPVTATGIYYAEATLNGCVNNPRKRAVVTVYALLASPVAVVDSAGVNFIRFRWIAVPNAVSYSVSTDGGTTFIVPSSGANGLTHTVTPLLPLTSSTLIVRANGAVSCQNSLSAPVTGKTLPDQIYIPNAFTPNGDGRNDVWLVYGYTIKNMQVAIFNQWGQKIFESSSQQVGWNGTYKGQQQPVGVYVYVIKMTLNDGTQMDKKGSINLAR